MKNIEDPYPVSCTLMPKKIISRTFSVIFGDRKGGEILLVYISLTVFNHVTSSHLTSVSHAT